MRADTVCRDNGGPFNESLIYTNMPIYSNRQGALYAAGMTIFALWSTCASATGISGQIGASLTKVTGMTSVQDHLLDASFLRFSARESISDGLSLEIRLDMPIDVGTGRSGSNGKLWNQSFLRVHLGEDQSLTVGKQFHVGVDRISDSMDVYEVSGSSAMVLPLALVGTNHYAGLSGRIERVIKFRAGRHGPLAWSASFSPAVPGYGRSESLEMALAGSTCEVGVFGIRYHAPAEISSAVQTFKGLGGKCRLGMSETYFAAYRNSVAPITGSGPTQRQVVVHAGVAYRLSNALKLRAAWYLERGDDLNHVPGRDGEKRTVVASLDWRLSPHWETYAAVFANALKDGYAQEINNLDEFAGKAPRGISFGFKQTF